MIDYIQKIKDGSMTDEDRSTYEELRKDNFIIKYGSCLNPPQEIEMKLTTYAMIPTILFLLIVSTVLDYLNDTVNKVLNKCIPTDLEDWLSTL